VYRVKVVAVHCLVFVVMLVEMVFRVVQVLEEHLVMLVNLALQVVMV